MKKKIVFNSDSNKNCRHLLCFTDIFLFFVSDFVLQNRPVLKKKITKSCACIIIRSAETRNIFYFIFEPSVHCTRGVFFHFSFLFRRAFYCNLSYDTLRWNSHILGVCLLFYYGPPPANQQR